ncbi:HD domain-containing protein (plasmid) [Embleya sp. NBC_00888]|uniref:HD domain-containing protein n=1 Tax=Embleya sp. NBC_00888 TaxID=2975960 RepID=UPI002F90913A|nr:HD domain-containing protein [Embleya sp. NBC_00888]
MNTIAAVPTTPTARRAIEYVRACESAPIAEHSFRSYRFAVLHAAHEGLRPGADFDPDLLFLACALHDLGTSPHAEGRQRFEVEGADLAAAFLTDNGLASADVDRVWEAIALHTSAGIAERRGSLTYLTRKGIAIDFGVDTECVTDAQARAIHAEHPRLRMAESLAEAVVRHARRSPENAPRYSLPGELLRERGRDGSGRTQMEEAAASSRWGV